MTALVAVLAASLLTTSAPAQGRVADPGSGAMGAESADLIPTRFTEPDWDRYPATFVVELQGMTDPHQLFNRWVYTDFPTACNNNRQAKAWQVLWVRRADDPAWLAERGVKRDLRAALRGAASVFPASVGRPIRNEADLRTSLAPRFTTWEAEPGICHPGIHKIELDTEHEHILTDTDPHHLTRHLVELGYNEPNRKYVVMVQGDTIADGWAQLDVDDDRPQPHLNRNNNPDPDMAYRWADNRVPGSKGGTSFVFVEVDNRHDLLHGYVMETLVHEMAHSLGAVLATSPDWNPQNRGHSIHSRDVLAYNVAGEGEILRCGKQSNAPRALARLDCGRDGYFNPDPAPGTWLAQHWNIANSDFLWGNNNEPPLSPAEPERHDD